MNTIREWALVCVGLVSLARAAQAGAPVVVESTPGHADIVDPALREIKIVFDRPMSKGQSICGGGPTFPQITGQPAWTDPQTMTIPVALQPGHEYAICVNSPSNKNFRDVDGTPAEVTPIFFRTFAAGETPPAIDAPAKAELIAALKLALDERYSYRDLHGVDWEARFQTFAPRFESSQTLAAFARAAAELLRINNDLHVTLRVNGFTLGTGRREITPNANLALIGRAIPGLKSFSRGSFGSVDDAVGYIAIHEWSGGDDVQRELDQAIDALKDKRALIVDVRLNSGGDESLARHVASRFVEQRHVYSKSLIRDPSNPTGWSGPFDRVVGPATDGPRFAGKVAVLVGPACMSSNESFVLMMRKPGLRELIGQRTWGSSGNPRPHDVGCGVVVVLPSWKDLDPDGRAIEGVGIAPDQEVAWPGDGSTDPVLARAIEWLHAP